MKKKININLGKLQVGIRALVWWIMVHSQVCIKSNSGLKNFFLQKHYLKSVYQKYDTCNQSEMKWFPNQSEIKYDMHDIS